MGRFRRIVLIARLIRGRLRLLAAPTYGYQLRLRPQP